MAQALRLATPVPAADGGGSDSSPAAGRQYRVSNVAGVWCACMCAALMLPRLRAWLACR